MTQALTVSVLSQRSDQGSFWLQQAVVFCEIFIVMFPSELGRDQKQS